MQHAAQRFIRTVLAIHLALLIIVALIVAGAAHNIRRKAREEAIAQAQSTQELIAQQTARGVENYYHAVTSVLELLRPSQEEEGATTAPSGPSGFNLLAPPGPPPGAPPNQSPNGVRQSRSQEMIAMRKRLVETLWRDVQARVSLLFVLDAYNNAPRSGTAGPSTSAAADPRMVIRDSFGDEQGLSAKQVVDHLSDWLRHIDASTVSTFQNIDGLHCNVVVVPIRSPNSRRMLVAVVPIDRIEEDLFANVNARATTGAILVDDAGTIMSDSHPENVGVNITGDSKTPRISAMAASYMQEISGGTKEFASPETVNGVTFPPSLITVEPIELKEFGGKRWWLGISSGLSEVDAVVNRLFGAAVVWAVFVVISVCAILLSTAIQLIRGRLRLERLQHQMLESELNQAREIQLNWLPHQSLHDTEIHVAAVNRPANRISGDFYNWFELPDGRIVVAIGDVTGHGMAAAFLMATTQLLVRGAMMRVGDPGLCLEDVNRQLCTQVFHGQFVTILLLAIDTEKQSIELATAGHPAPLVCDDKGLTKLAVEPQLVLGVVSETRYPTQRFDLSKSSKLLLYTDGVVDAVAASGERFKLERLRKCLNADASGSPQSMLDAVMEAVDVFRHGHDLSDDLTLVAIQLQPSATAATLVGAGI
jgi:serine phosphatase RsbU (regulator of sigma subunit)/type II secretory pathway pseudopilin PulG